LDETDGEESVSIAGPDDEPATAAADRGAPR
ncbi:bifunctional pyr operon transcriptional regulator/uracil phosphoribosyltransferase, partial [Clavibacter michiganensis subsp. insidiosus]